MVTSSLPAEKCFFATHWHVDGQEAICRQMTNELQAAFVTCCGVRAFTPQTSKRRTKSVKTVECSQPSNEEWKVWKSKPWLLKKHRHEPDGDRRSRQVILMSIETSLSTRAMRTLSKGCVIGGTRRRMVSRRSEWVRYRHQPIGRSNMRSNHSTASPNDDHTTCGH